MSHIDTDLCSFMPASYRLNVSLMGQTLSTHKEIKSDFCFPTLKGNVILKYVFFRQRELQIARFWANDHHSYAKLSPHWQSRMKNLGYLVYLEKANLIITFPKQTKEKKKHL